jgi:hypothetical protein
MHHHIAMQVNLQHVIQDAYEYHGASRLAWFIIYFALCNMVLFMHWDINTPVMKSSAQQGWGLRRAMDGCAYHDWLLDKIYCALSGMLVLELISPSAAAAISL